MSCHMYRRINVMFIKMFSKVINCVIKSIYTCVKHNIYTCVLKFPLEYRASSGKLKDIAKKIQFISSPPSVSSTPTRCILPLVSSTYALFCSVWGSFKYSSHESCFSHNLIGKLPITPELKTELQRRFAIVNHAVEQKWHVGKSRV